MHSVYTCTAPNTVEKAEREQAGSSSLQDRLAHEHMSLGTLVERILRVFASCLLQDTDLYGSLLHGQVHNASHMTS
jgi:hypothetical protein